MREARRKKAELTKSKMVAAGEVLCLNVKIAVASEQFNFKCE